MFNIDFYETYDGHSDIQEFLDSLRVKAASVKDARIQYGQIARAKSEMKDYIARKEAKQ